MTGSGAARVVAEQVTARGARAVVAAASPLAAAAGAAAFAAGGNAYDAVVAAALVETVVLPSKCGLGGDLIAIVRPAGAAEPEALLAIGGASAGLAALATAVAGADGADAGSAGAGVSVGGQSSGDGGGNGGWEDTGPNSVGPPAAPAGYLALAARGRLPLADLAHRAIELAHEGFAWAAVNERLTTASADLLRHWNSAGNVFLPGDVPIGAGSIVRLPGHGAALAELVAAGSGAAFLAGPFGGAVVATVERHGGVLHRHDLDAFARADWTPCAASDTGGLRLWTTPAPTHGPSLLAAMAGARSGDAPAAVYRRSLTAIAERRLALGEDAGANPSGTSIVSAADAEGNAVVVVHSNSYPRFGSGLLVDGYDVVLANRAGRGFTAVAGHPNFPTAGSRPATTLHAWMAAPGEPTTTDRTVWLGGTPGGDNQMTWNTQLLQQLVDGERSPGPLVVAPRWEWLPADDGVRLEAGFDSTAVAELEAAAPRVLHTGAWGLACAQQVLAVRAASPGAGPAVDALAAAADPRTVGLALGV